MDETTISSENKHANKIILALSIPLLVLLAIASYSGIFISATYARNTTSFAAQGIGQDIVNLFIVAPLLLLSTILYYKGNKKAMFLWAGLLSYILYSYVIYGFAQPFNFLFLVYCAILGISFYAFMYFVISKINGAIKDWYEEKFPKRAVIIYFVIIAALFYFVWLSEVVPALLNDEIPESIIENGTTTNPVHVLDLSILLPALLITGIFLFRDNKFGYLLAPILLVFLTFMALAVIGMIIAMIILGVETDLGLSVIFGLIIMINIVISFLVFRTIKS